MITFFATILLCAYVFRLSRTCEMLRNLYCARLTLMRLTYSMAQQPLNNFDRPLMKVSLFNSTLVTLISYYRQSDEW